MHHFFLSCVLALALPACAGTRIAADGVFLSGSDLHAGHDHGGHDHQHGARPAVPSVQHEGHAHALREAGHAHGTPRRLLRCNICDGWMQPWEHGHLSANGTPYVHPFLSEPAYLGRDLFVDFAHGAEGGELEAEVAWALTRRVGVIAELPFSEENAAVSLRFLLIENPDFLFSASTEVEFPLVTEEGDVAVGAFVHSWVDLGAWYTLQTQTGFEFVPDTEGVELVWRFALGKSFCTCPLFGHVGVPAHGGHGPHAMSILAEVAGRTCISGDASGETVGQWLTGLSYPLADRLDLRGAYFQDFEGESGWRLGFIVHN